MIESTFVMLKPDAFEKRVVGRVLNRIEDEHFHIAKMEQLQLTQGVAEHFYAEHQGKPFFEPLVKFMTSGPVLAMVLERENAIKHWRSMLGSSDSRSAAFDTIRERHGDKTGLAIWRNIAHGSDSKVAAVRETAHFFDYDHKLDADSVDYFQKIERAKLRTALEGLVEQARAMERHWDQQTNLTREEDAFSKYQFYSRYAQRLDEALAVEEA